MVLNSSVLHPHGRVAVFIVAICQTKDDLANLVNYFHSKVRGMRREGNEEFLTIFQIATVRLHAHAHQTNWVPLQRNNAYQTSYKRGLECKFDHSITVTVSCEYLRERKRDGERERE